MNVSKGVDDAFPLVKKVQLSKPLSSIIMMFNKFLQGKKKERLVLSFQNALF
jgi:hypothetical protein